MQRNFFQASTAVFLLLLIGCCHCCLLELEAEHGDTSGKTKFRSQASGGVSVLLRTEQRQVSHCVSTASTCWAQVENVRYSNDGLSDSVQVSLDGTTMGTFETRVKSDHGRAWNEFLSTGSIGEAIKIRAGNHELTLSVLRSDDSYGVELDKTTLRLTCEGRRTNGDEECPSAFTCARA